VLLLVIYLLYESFPAIEGFTVPQRSDIGYGWGEEAGYARDQRYQEAFVDIMGHGVAADFCRSVAKKGDPESLRVACALGTRDGMSTMEYTSKTKRDGFLFSRDDYWRANKGRKGRQDYCRIVKDQGTGEWYSTCAIAGATGFNDKEERDTDPPPAIQKLLRAYHGILTWYRWRDDGVDYSQNTAIEARGTPKVPDLIKAELSRGLELNRWPVASQEAGEHRPPLKDLLRWGEKGTLALDQAVPPRQIRAIATWVYWDAFERGARILECSNGSKEDLMWLGVEGGGHDLPGLEEAPRVQPAVEVAPTTLAAIGQLTEPAKVRPKPPTPAKSATYAFEIWDKEQRIMRLAAPMASAEIGKWQHVVVTTTGTDTWWPTWSMWIDGRLVVTRTDGRMSPALELTQNYIGKHMRGCLQDFRIYREPMTETKIQEAIAWSKPALHPQP
jgi:hypothetical protein